MRSVRLRLQILSNLMLRTVLLILSNTTSAQIQVRHYARQMDRTEAHLIQIACDPAPEGHSRWTLRLLEEKARIEHGNTSQQRNNPQGIKKMNLDLTSMTIGASRQKRMQNS